MLKVYRVETKQTEASKRAVEVSQELSADAFIAGMHEHRSEYQHSLDIFSENHRKIYEKVKNLRGKEDWILLCIEERWGLSPPETNFGLASLESFREVFWRSWTTVNIQRSYNPNIPEEPTFKNAFKRQIREYFDQETISKTPVLVADQHNFERCLSVLDEMGLEYRVMS